MAESESGGRIVRLGEFDLDLGTGELRCQGELVPLRPQPTRLLLLLARNAGRLVERDEIRNAVWSGSVVEFDQGINACVRQIRSTLGDSAAEPRYIETVPRRGYRLIAPATRANEAAVADPAPGPAWRALTPGRLVVLLAIAMALAAAAAWMIRDGSGGGNSIVVVPLPGTFADAELAGLPDTLAARIAEAIGSGTDREIRLVPWTGASRFDAEQGEVLTGDSRITADYIVSATADQRDSRIVVAVEIHGARAALPVWRREYTSYLSAADSLARSIAGDVATAVHEPSLWVSQ